MEVLLAERMPQQILNEEDAAPTGLKVRGSVPRKRHFHPLYWGQ